MSIVSNNKSLLEIVLRWKIHLGIVTGLAVVLSVLFSSSWFITPKYRSWSVVYPSNLIPYSSETPTEQLLQLLESVDIQDQVIEKFNLSGHYGIDSNQPAYYSKIKKAFSKHVSITKTEFESIEVSVLDKNPQMACDIVNAIIEFANLKARNMQREKTGEVVEIYKNQLSQKTKMADSLKTKISKLRSESNIIDFDAQVKEASRQYFTMLREKNTAPSGNELSAFMVNLEENGGELFILNAQLQSTIWEVNRLQNEYDKAVSDLTKELTYTNLVTTATPSDKKAYPIRWLIVTISTLSTFLLALIACVALERHRLMIQKPEDQNTA